MLKFDYERRRRYGFFLSEEKILTIKNVLMLLLNISEIFINIKLYFD